MTIRNKEKEQTVSLIAHDYLPLEMHRLYNVLNICIVISTHECALSMHYISTYVHTYIHYHRLYNVLNIHSTCKFQDALLC